MVWNYNNNVIKIWSIWDYKNKNLKVWFDMKYIALLRGINISGKNKISMAELKKEFEDNNCKNVITYLNSGNVIFECSMDNKETIREEIYKMVKNKFNLDIPIFIISALELEDILNNKPKWWGTDNKDIYDNLIFIIPPTKYEEIKNILGFDIDHSFLTYKKELKDYGYQVGKISMKEKTVSFSKI